MSWHIYDGAELCLVRVFVCYSKYQYQMSRHRGVANVDVVILVEVVLALVMQHQQQLLMVVEVTKSVC